MAGWTESGIFANVFAGNLTLTAAYPDWIGTTVNSVYLTTNSDTPTWQAAAGSAIYATTYETHDSGANWPAGGPTLAVAFAGASTIPAWSITGSAPTTTLNHSLTHNISIASTTIASGAYGCYFYLNSGTKYQFIGIYFGGSGYTTSAGTFAINWSGPVVTFALAA